jgi:glycosyltransferase involved in cell wall biosynthesis
VSLGTERCYAIALDCAEIAAKFFGVPKKKIDISPLGVDTDLFLPTTTEHHRRERQDLRRRLGLSPAEVVCIYTGRLTEDKNPLLLASAIAELRARGEGFSGLFVGSGPQRDEIKSRSGCVVHPFVPVYELPSFYRAADIAVWPTQESLSMLDAAACGLPIVANDTVSTPERLEGNGVTYRLNDVADLTRVLYGLRHQQQRERLGLIGSRKITRQFSWSSIAKKRLGDYQASIGGKTARVSALDLKEYQPMHD